MSNMRYICLSDKHLGEEDSILTNINANVEADAKTVVLNSFRKCKPEEKETRKL